MAGRAGHNRKLKGAINKSLKTASSLRISSTQVSGLTNGTVTNVTYTGDGTVHSSTPSTAVTTSGTLTASLNTQSANKVFAGPTSGGAVAPTFRSLVSGDLPTIAGKIVGIQVFTASGSNTYTPSAGVNNALVFLWGGGGGGGASTSASVAGGGGGGGAHACSYVAVSGSVTISVGVGGTGQLANNGTAGTNGGDTTYNSTTIVAKGGTHGANTSVGTGGAAGSSTGTLVLSGIDGGTPNNVAGNPGIGGGSPMLGVIAAFSGNWAVASPNNTAMGGRSGFSAQNASNGGSGLAIVIEFS